MSTPGVEQHYTIPQAAERLAVSQKWIRRRLAEGEIASLQLRRPSSGKRGGVKLIPESELLAMMDRMRA